MSQWLLRTQRAAEWALRKCWPWLLAFVSLLFILLWLSLPVEGSAPCTPLRASEEGH